LTPEEARAAYRGGPAPVTRADIETALGESGAVAMQRLEAELQSLSDESRGLETLGASLSPEQRRWRDLAHAIFNLKEFVYVK
ncbi:MAG: hypothetical protein KDN18_23095, partial [Verrucomicrobiae bacterium]|nr:hypothetical protein [Verrucomicrobiae bacterium]